MFIRIIAMFVIASSAMFAQFTEAGKSLGTELNRLKCDTALIGKSNAIDEYVLWSKDGSHVALNLMGKWIKIDLNNIELIDAKWRGGLPLGVNIKKEGASMATEAEIKEWQSITRLYPREVVLPSGIKIELRELSMATALVFTSKEKMEKTIWTTGGENCHSISLSPTGEYFAFISEMNGAVIMRCPK